MHSNEIYNIFHTLSTNLKVMYPCKYSSFAGGLAISREISCEISCDH